jgi:hypothetical protein
MKKIKLSNGTEIGTFEPPAHGIDPLKASQADLEKHGFPSRPTNAHQLGRYTRVTLMALCGRLRKASSLPCTGTLAFF